MTKYLCDISHLFYGSSLAAVRHAWIIICRA